MALKKTTIMEIEEDNYNFFIEIIVVKISQYGFKYCVESEEIYMDAQSQAGSDIAIEEEEDIVNETGGVLR